ncbi:uncharacterized protein LOC109793394 [Cajanus cajan]|uniref:Uncharacterized protein n=1 Tax=Cajanus cajan TaxID=3821 RepID=A0A151QPP9_CAJCA|nr:uncharacterized protein LOC109793394 [Cajanus cajan]KYP32279.1 hypothetical protein KK1_047081 [Cajanus cajan]
MEINTDKVINGGPWMIFDHYLTVRPWSLDFSALEDHIEKTIIWVRFSNLNMMFYNESVLLMLASAIGKPLRVDNTTINMFRGYFARVCVEIDLSQPVVGKFSLNGKWHNVEYEGLHMLCSTCGCYGHITQNFHTKTHPAMKESQVVVLPHDHGKETLHESMSRVTPISEQENIMLHESRVESSTKSDSSNIEPHGEWLVVKRKNRKSGHKSNGKSSKDLSQIFSFQVGGNKGKDVAAKVGPKLVETCLENPD